MHNGKVELALTRRDHNLVLRHIDDAFTQLVKTGNYRPSRDEANASLAAESTVIIDLSKVRLQGTDNEWRYLEICTGNYDSLHPEERKLAERVHGSGDVFSHVMNMLSNKGIIKTRVYVLNPSYVQAQTKEGPIGRASWLDNISDNSSFSAVGRGVDYDYRLRGVPRRPVASVSEPRAQEHSTETENIFTTSYAMLLANPEQALANLNDERANQLEAILNQYRSRK